MPFENDKYKSEIYNPKVFLFFVFFFAKAPFRINLTLLLPSCHLKTTDTNPKFTIPKSFCFLLRKLCGNQAPFSISLTLSLPSCHLKTTNTNSKFKISVFLLCFFFKLCGNHAPISISLTLSLPSCHLQTTNTNPKIKTVSLHVFLFALNVGFPSKCTVLKVHV